MTQDLAYGWRTLARSPAFTVTAILTLALGIGATSAAFSLVDGVLLQPLPYGRPNRLVEIRELGEGRQFFPSFPNFVDWRARSTSFRSMVALEPLGAQPVLDVGDPARFQVLVVTRDFLATAGVAPFLGRDFTAEENAVGGPDVALVSHRFWVTRLGSVRDLSRASFTALSARYRVVGVLPPGFRLLYPADVYVPAERWPGTVRSAHAYRVVARLRDGVSIQVAAQEMDVLTAAMNAEYGDDTNAERAQLRSLADVLLGNQRRPLALLLAAALLVLLVACANVASTLLARGTGRTRELAVRTSLGAARARLVRQLLTETLLLAGVAGVAGTLLAWGAVSGAVALAPRALPRLGSVHLDARVLAFTASVALGTAFVFGLLPAFHLTRDGLAGALRSGGRSGSARRGRLWDGLIAGEVAMSMVLLVGATLLVRSLLAIVTLHAGWRPEGALQMEVSTPGGTFASSDEAVAFYRSLERDLAGLPGVRAVGFGNYGPMDAGNWTAPAHDADTGKGIGGYAGWRLVDSGYFDALGVRLMQGRLFRPDDRDVVVVNEELAHRLWGDADPIGRHIVSNFDARSASLEVIGVVPVARDWRWDPAEQMEMFVPWWTRADQVQSVKLFLRSDGDHTALIASARARVRAADPRAVAEFATLTSEISDSTADRRFVAAILACFAVAALLLSLVGIFGVVSYAVAQRRREIGIRLALGAASTRVRARIRRETLRPTLVGLAIGVVGALALARVVQSLLYDGVAARDPVTLAGVGAMFLIAATLAADLPARRTARVDPGEVLREE